MPALYTIRICVSCGKAHELWLADADFFDDIRDYEYTCPATNRSVAFRPTTWNKVVPVCPPDSVKTWPHE